MYGILIPYIQCMNPVQMQEFSASVAVTFTSKFPIVKSIFHQNWYFINSVLDAGNIDPQSNQYWFHTMNELEMRIQNFI